MEKEQQMGPEMREVGGKSQRPGEHVSRRK